jgi:hypothetical protein
LDANGALRCVQTVASGQGETGLDGVPRVGGTFATLTDSYGSPTFAPSSSAWETTTNQGGEDTWQAGWSF